MATKTPRVVEPVPEPEDPTLRDPLVALVAANAAKAAADAALAEARQAYLGVVGPGEAWRFGDAIVTVSRPTVRLVLHPGRAQELLQAEGETLLDYTHRTAIVRVPASRLDDLAEHLASDGLTLADFGLTADTVEYEDAVDEEAVKERVGLAAFDEQDASVPRVTIKHAPRGGS